MADITRTLSFTVLDPFDQTPIEGAKIKIKLTKSDYTSEGTVLRSDVSILTDENGQATVSLIPNVLGTQRSQYSIKITQGGRKLVDEVVTMPDQDSVLSDLVDAEEPITLTDAQITLAAAQEQANVATAQATIATNSATAAAASETAAEGYRDQAAVSASEVEANRLTVVSARDQTQTYAAEALVSRNEAEGFSTSASNSASSAASYAATALLAASVYLHTDGIANATPIIASNFAEDGTIEMIQVDTSDRVVVGDATADMLVKGGSITIEGDVTITGDLQTTTANEVNIGDAVILLNAYETGAPTVNAGFEIERGTDTNVAFLWNETLDRWEIDQAFHSSGNIIIDKSNPKLILRADDSSSPMVTYQNESGTDQWALYTSVGASGAQGDFFLYNYNTAVNVFSVDENTNLFTFSSATPVQIDNNLTIGGTLGVTGAVSFSDSLHLNGVSAAHYSGSETLSAGLSSFKVDSGSVPAIYAGNVTEDGPIISLMDTGGVARGVISIENSSAKTMLTTGFGFKVAGTIEATGSAAFAGVVYVGSTDSYLQESSGDLYLGSGGTATIKLGSTGDVTFSDDVNAAGNLLVEGGTGTHVIQANMTSASSAGDTGAFYATTTDGAAMSNGHRVGGYFFGGAFDGTNAIGLSASIIGFATENWSSGARGTELQFQTTANGGTSRATKMILSNAGALSTTTGSLGTISERRFKENIVPATSQWEDTKTLASLMKNYNLIDGDGSKLLGWVVDEIEDEFPALVFETQGGGVKNVNMSAITYKGFGALGEALQRIEGLESRVAELRAA
jgi:hypothetical protein